MNGSEDAIALVREFLEATMRQDSAKAAHYVAEDLKITFTGGRRFSSSAQIAAFNRERYRRVDKRYERFDVCVAGADLIVYSLGTLYGEWPDGQPFDGNRYIDRFTIRGGRIVAIEVWNDSAELILMRR